MSPRTGTPASDIGGVGSGRWVNPTGLGWGRMGGKGDPAGDRGDATVLEGVDGMGRAPGGWGHTGGDAGTVPSPGSRSRIEPPSARWETPSAAGATPRPGEYPAGWGVPTLGTPRAGWEEGIMLQGAKVCPSFCPSTQE